MNIKKLIIGLIILCCIVFYVLYQRIVVQSNMQKTKPYIVCTTTIIGDTIQQIAQNSVHIDILMGPGVDPHVYKPIENDLLKIAKANLIVYHGLHLEARMVDLFAHLNSIKPTVDATKDIPKHLLISVNDQRTIFDPHVWFDPQLWIYVVTTIATKLTELLPENSDVYEHNKNIFIDQIRQMYQATRLQIQQIPTNQRILITSHDAFSYFARAYDFKVVSLQGINTATEAGVQDVQDVVSIILKHQIPTIFVESSVPPRSMQAIQQRVATQHGNVKIGQELYSDSLGNPKSPAGTYLGMLNYNVDAILQGLLPIS